MTFSREANHRPLSVGFGSGWDEQGPAVGLGADGLGAGQMPWPRCKPCSLPARGLRAPPPSPVQQPLHPRPETEGPQQGHARQHGGAPAAKGPARCHGAGCAHWPGGCTRPAGLQGRACSPCPRSRSCRAGWTGWSPGGSPDTGCRTWGAGCGQQVGRPRRASRSRHTHTCTDTATRTHRGAHTTPTWGNADQHICHTPHEALPHACPATRGTTPLHEGWWPWGGVRLQAFPTKEDLFPLVPCPRVCRPVLSSEVALLYSEQACLPRSTYEFIFYWNCLAISIVVTWNVIITKVHPLGRKFPEPGARSQPLRWPWPRA